MKLNKVIAIPAVALAAGLSLAVCGSVKAPALGINHTLPQSAAAPVATKTTHSAKPAPVATTPAAASKAAVAQPAAQVPVLDVSTDGYSGIKPGEIGFSGDGGYIITGIIWSSWGPNEADGTGTSSIQGCVPDCATGSETPYTDTIVLSDPQGGQLTQVSSTRDGTVKAGSTSLILGAEQNSPDAAPAAPALTDCGNYLYVNADTSCSFAQNVEADYTGLGPDYASSPVIGLNYTMNCVRARTMRAIQVTVWSARVGITPKSCGLLTNRWLSCPTNCGHGGERFRLDRLNGGGIMRFNKIIAATAVALTAAFGTGMAVALTTSPASAVDLVNYDGGSIHLGHSIQLGVWYQQFSGGPSGYWAGVWSYPAHRWIFIRSGHATTSWHFWSVKPSQRGKYATVYDVDGVRVVFYTTVK